MSGDKTIKILIISILILLIIFALRITIFKDSKIIKSATSEHNITTNSVNGISDNEKILESTEKNMGKIAQSSGNFLGMMKVIIIISMTISIIISVIMIGSMWKIFEDAGIPGWQSIIPILNIVRILQIVDLSGWLILLMIIPYLGGIIAFILHIIITSKLSEKYGRSVLFTIGLILLPIIFYPILAFSKNA